MVASAGAPSGDIRVLPLDEPLESLVHVEAWAIVQSLSSGCETRWPSPITHLDFALALSGAAVRRNAASGSTRTFKSL